MSEKPTTIDIMNHNAVIQANKDLVDENSTLRAELERMKKEKDEMYLSSVIGDLRRDLDRVTRERDALKEMLDGLKGTLHECELILDDLQAGYEEAKAERARRYFDRQASLAFNVNFPDPF